MGLLECHCLSLEACTFCSLECSVHRRLEYFQVADVLCVNIPQRFTKQAVCGDLRWIFWIHTALLAAVNR